jgi:hypothetical protein
VIKRFDFEKREWVKVSDAEVPPRNAGGIEEDL